jgi:hypothetical protein
VRDLYRDTGPRFFRSHPKERPIQSSLTTRKGMRRTYSNPDPHGVFTQRYVSRFIGIHCSGEGVQCTAKIGIYSEFQETKEKPLLFVILLNREFVTSFTTNSL